MAEPKRHVGSCHCGAVRFEVMVDATAGTRCNCSICTKTAATGALAKPGALTVTAGAEHLSGYRTGTATRHFCKHCGIHLYGDGHVEELGGAFLSVNLNALDDLDLSQIAIGYFDGRHDNWMAGTRETPWPSGIGASPS
jgi:hypothetical protein